MKQKKSKKRRYFIGIVAIVLGIILFKVLTEKESSDTIKPIKPIGLMIKIRGAIMKQLHSGFRC